MSFLLGGWGRIKTYFPDLFNNYIFESEIVNSYKNFKLVFQLYVSLHTCRCYVLNFKLVFQLHVSLHTCRCYVLKTFLAIGLSSIIILDTRRKEGTQFNVATKFGGRLKPGSGMSLMLSVDTSCHSCCEDS